MDPKQRARSVRIRQLLLLIGGVSGALAMPLTMSGVLGGAAALGSVASMILVPIAYFLFAASVEDAVAEIVGEPGAKLRWRAILTFVPLLGSLFEVALLFGLAKETARIEGAEDRSAPVLWLAIARVVAAFVGPLFASFFLTFSEGPPYAFMIAYTVGPLASFALLGFITQIIATPIFDQVLARQDFDLGAAGATSSMAVSSNVDRD
jgi:hypothetical protein